MKGNKTQEDYAHFKEFLTLSLHVEYAYPSTLPLFLPTPISQPSFQKMKRKNPGNEVAT